MTNTNNELKKAVAKKLTKKLGSFSEAVEYFEKNTDFEPELEEKTAATICPSCDERIVRDEVLYCPSCDKAYRANVTASSKSSCPSCGEAMEKRAISKCGCGTRFASSSNLKRDAAEKLAAYLGRNRKLTKEASVKVEAALMDEDTVSWGDCICDQYADGHSVDDSVKICKVIKKQVMESVAENENKRKIEGSTTIKLTKAQLGMPVDDDIDDIDDIDDGGDEEEVIEVEIKFRFDPITQEIEIVETETEIKPLEEDSIEEVSEDVFDEEFTEDDSDEEWAEEVVDEIGTEDDSEDINIDMDIDGVEEVSEKVPGVPARDGSGGGTGHGKEVGEPGIPSGEGPGADSDECPFNNEDEDEDEDGEDIEVAQKDRGNKGVSEANKEEGTVDISEFVEASNDIPEFEEVMIEGTTLDIPREAKEGMTKDEIREARRQRLAKIIKGQKERQAALETVEPGNYGYKRPLGDDTSNDPQANNTKGSAPSMGDQSRTHKPEPKKQIQTLDGDNPLQAQNDSVQSNRPQIPTQRELELQETAVQQKDRIEFEGEPYSEQMKQNSSYDLAEPEIPVSKTTPHDNEDYSQEELRRPRIPAQTEEGRYEMEFTAANKELYKKAAKAALIAEGLELIGPDEFDNKVEQLASAGEDYIDSYLQDIQKLSASKQNIKSAKPERVARKEANQEQGATSALFVPNEQSYEGSEEADIKEIIAGGFSIGGGASQKSISLEDFRKMAAEEVGKE